MCPLKLRQNENTAETEVNERLRRLQVVHVSRVIYLTLFAKVDYRLFELKD